MGGNAAVVCRVSSNRHQLLLLGSTTCSMTHIYCWSCMSSTELGRRHTLVIRHTSCGLVVLSLHGLLEARQAPHQRNAALQQGTLSQCSHGAHAGAAKARKEVSKQRRQHTRGLGTASSELSRQWAIPVGLYSHLAATPPCCIRIQLVVGPLQSHHSINLNCQLLLPDIHGDVFCRVHPEGYWEFHLNL